MASPTIHDVARDVLARHVHRDMRSVPMWHSLGRDLHLTPLELVVVALEIEEAGDVDVEIEELAAVDTVGDFFRCLSKAAAHPRALACA